MRGLTEPRSRVRTYRADPAPLLEDRPRPEQLRGQLSLFGGRKRDSVTVGDERRPAGQPAADAAVT